jgi:hypothetical protein
MLPADYFQTTFPKEEEEEEEEEEEKEANTRAFHAKMES